MVLLRALYIWRIAKDIYIYINVGYNSTPIGTTEHVGMVKL